MTEIAEVKTIGEVERIVHASGLWDGTGPVEFSDDRETWTQAWAPSEDHPHPEHARVAVYRKDVRIPTTVTIRWAEQFPEASEEWAAKWLHSPMRHFGRTARMVGFRQTFRDILGDISIEDEERITPTGPAEAESAAAPRDWAAEIADATTVPDLDKVDADAREARAFKPDAAGTALHRQMRDRRKELLADAAEAWQPATEEQPERPAPQDHLPAAGNRAARRSAARKKGKRR